MHIWCTSGILTDTEFVRGRRKFQGWTLYQKSQISDSQLECVCMLMCKWTRRVKHSRIEDIMCRILCLLACKELYCVMFLTLLLPCNIIYQSSSAAAEVILPSVTVIDWQGWERMSRPFQFLYCNADMTSYTFSTSWLVMRHAGVLGVRKLKALLLHQTAVTRTNVCEY